MGLGELCCCIVHSRHLNRMIVKTLQLYPDSKKRWQHWSSRNITTCFQKPQKEKLTLAWSHPGAVTYKYMSSTLLQNWPTGKVLLTYHIMIFSQLFKIVKNHVFCNDAECMSRNRKWIYFFPCSAKSWKTWFSDMPKMCQHNMKQVYDFLDALQNHQKNMCFFFS